MPEYPAWASMEYVTGAVSPQDWKTLCLLGLGGGMRPGLTSGYPWPVQLTSLGWQEGVMPEMSLWQS